MFVPGYDYMPLEAKLTNEAKVHYTSFEGGATKGSAGFDLRAILPEPLEIKPGERVLINTGLHVHVNDPKWMGLVLMRSGTAHNHGLMLSNSVGLIDSDYTGEIKMSILNTSKIPYVMEPGERIGQYVLAPTITLSLFLVDEFSEESERGEGGFGHTGKH